MALSRENASAPWTEIINGPLRYSRYREKRERIPSRFELFFDLVFVAIAHQLSDTAAEHASVEGFVQFLLASFFTLLVCSSLTLLL